MLEDLSSEISIEESNTNYLSIRRRLSNSSMFMTSTELVTFSTPNSNNDWFHSECFKQDFKVLPTPLFSHNIANWMTQIKDTNSLKEEMKTLGVDG
jgi:hypothetical protein